jgi:hypothetical protein
MGGIQSLQREAWEKTLFGKANFKFESSRSWRVQSQRIARRAGLGHNPTLK